jgi:hypothetical protein
MILLIDSRPIEFAARGARIAALVTGVRLRK